MLPPATPSPATLTPCQPHPCYPYPLSPLPPLLSNSLRGVGWMPPHSFSILPPATPTLCHSHPLPPPSPAIPIHCHPLPLLSNHPTHLKLFGNKGGGVAVGWGGIGGGGRGRSGRRWGWQGARVMGVGLRSEEATTPLLTPCHPHPLPPPPPPPYLFCVFYAFKP